MNSLMRGAVQVFSNWKSGVSLIVYLNSQSNSLVLFGDFMMEVIGKNDLPKILVFYQKLERNVLGFRNSLSQAIQFDLFSRAFEGFRSKPLTTDAMC